MTKEDYYFVPAEAGRVSIYGIIVITVAIVCVLLGIGIYCLCFGAKGCAFKCKCPRRRLNDDGY